MGLVNRPRSRVPNPCSSALISTFWIVKFKYADNISAALHLSIFLYLKEFIICKRFGIKL